MWRLALLLVLLLANAGYWAWSQGWLRPTLPPPRAAESEPQRLALQQRAQWVSVVPGAAGSAAVSAARAAARVCLEAGPFGGEGADEAAASAAALAWAGPAALAPGGAAPGSNGAAGSGWTLVNRPLPPAWWLSAGRYPEPAGRPRREAELRELKLGFEWVPVPAAAASAPRGWADIAPALVVSRHASAAAAEAALAALPLPARRTLRIVAAPAGPARWWIQVREADSDLQARLAALPAPPAAARGFARCAPGA
jgi:hypothetical protein